MFELIIQNALIYDGTGNAPFIGNIAVKDGKIAAVSTEDLGSAQKVVDAHGLALSPGFIDAHSHADYAVATDPHRLHVLRIPRECRDAGPDCDLPRPLPC